MAIALTKQEISARELLRKHIRVRVALLPPNSASRFITHRFIALHCTSLNRTASHRIELRCDAVRCDTHSY